MPAIIYPYTVTNSYKGGLFMRTYSRNVRRTWDGDDHRPTKRIRVDEHTGHPSSSTSSMQNRFPNKENTSVFIDDEDSLERAIRETSVAALSSSPSRKNSTIFSLESQEDDGTSTITPPSSPPPTAQLQITPPNVKARKPTFSFLDKSKKEKAKQNTLKRKHVPDACTDRDNTPLSEIHNSSRASSTFPNLYPPTTTTTQPSKSTHPLFQSRLDFGQPSLLPTTCPSPHCAMTYTPSEPYDIQLHNMYHSRHQRGIELGKPFLKSAMKWCYEVSHIPGSVVVVDRKISLPGRKTVKEVLSVVNRELGSVEIGEDELWGQRVVPGDEEGRKCDRYKVFLHVVEGRCVGVCLAERVGRCRRVVKESDGPGRVLEVNGHVRPREQSAVVASNDAPANSTIRLSEQTYSAIVGVSRIWTSENFRRKGIANNLIECVMNQFIYGMEIERNDVAFSQPTELGTRLARSWYGEEDDWGVYDED